VIVQAAVQISFGMDVTEARRRPRIDFLIVQSLIMGVWIVGKKGGPRPKITPAPPHEMACMTHFSATVNQKVLAQHWWFGDVGQKRLVSRVTRSLS
jgi:hypothetical protein